MTPVKVSIANRQKKTKIPTGARLLMKRCCHAVLAHEGFGRPAEISISFTDDTGIRELNSSFRGKDAPTDVLSFPLGENGNYDLNNETGAALLGDIVISMERAMEQAKLYGHSLEREIGFLTVHSMLHLLGYDHEKSSLESEIMREKEEEILTELGLSRELTYTPAKDEGQR